MTATHAASQVDAHRDCEAPRPGLSFEIARFLGRCCDGEIRGYSEEKINERLSCVRIAQWSKN
jgi:hypothetical protein